MSEYAFDAFISYSHKDLDEAKWLQHKLETYRIPKGIDNTKITGRKFRIFRDQTDLAGVELQEALQKELNASEYLIVICSPSSASSVWVNEEIRYFRSLGRENNIIPFIIAGEPETDKKDLECYPPMLRDMEDRHMLGTNIQEIGKNKAFLKLVSIMLDVRFNRLVDREKQRKRRLALIVGSSAAVIVAVVAGLLINNAVISQKNHELIYDIYGAALIRIAQKDYEDILPEEIEYLKDSANEGNAQAILFLSDFYKNGWGGEKDPEAAFDIITKGANAGDTACMAVLSNFYSEGTGTPVDDEQAFFWAQKAAEAGNSDAMLSLAAYYEKGAGTDADPQKAFEWYEKAALKDNDIAIHALAMCYLLGTGTDQDYSKAFEWEMKLAEKGLADDPAMETEQEKLFRYEYEIPMYNIGRMYQFGYGVEEDPEMAYYWYRKAADAGEGEAAYMVGWCTENNYGTKDAALEWYKRAAELGWADAEADIERLSH